LLTEDKGNIKEQGIRKLKEQIMGYISDGIRNILCKIDFKRISTIEEIRLRANKPLMIQNCCGDWFVKADGALTGTNADAFVVSQSEIIRTLELMSENSIYAYQDEIKNGFITLKGGHRVGISGKVVMDGNSIKNIKEISGLNIRISKEVLGCSFKIIRQIINKNDICNTLIISPPQCGKTTMLRDIARAVSDGVDELCFKGVKVGIVDERSEIAACYKGVPQNRVGVRTDVLDGCPKSIGMIMMIRSMSPNVIITDEIGGQGDRDAVMKVLNAGVKIITSAHGYNISELKSRQEVIGLIEGKIFEKYVVLSGAEGPGTIEEIIDGITMKEIYRRG